MATPENCLNTPWDLNPFSTNTGQYYDLGEYIPCALNNLWGYAQIIFIVLAIISMMRLVYKFATNRDNSSVLEEVQKEWPYVLILAIVAIGGAGTFLNIALKAFGLGGVDVWLKSLDDFVQWF